eukprot:1842264-Prymnesium_polylepis.1
MHAAHQHARGAVGLRLGLAALTRAGRALLARVRPVDAPRRRAVLVEHHGDGRTARSQDGKAVARLALLDDVPAGRVRAVAAGKGEGAERGLRRVREQRQRAQHLDALVQHPQPRQLDVLRGGELEQLHVGARDRRDCERLEPGERRLGEDGARLEHRRLYRLRVHLLARHRLHR